MKQLLRNWILPCCIGLMVPLAGNGAQLHGLVLNQAEGPAAESLENELTMLLFLGEDRINGNLVISQQRTGLTGNWVVVSYDGVPVGKMRQGRQPVPQAKVVSVARSAYHQILRMDRQRRAAVLERLGRSIQRGVR